MEIWLINFNCVLVASWGCSCYLSLPHGAVACCVVCDCDISCSYSIMATCTQQNSNRYLITVSCQHASLIYLVIQIRLPCTPRTIFMCAKLFVVDPLNAKRSCPKNVGMDYVKMHGSHGYPLHNSPERG